MQAVVNERGELRALAGSPLLLTVMALVHAFKGRPPDSRAQLYAECVDLLLLRWRQPGDGPDLLRRLGLSELKDTDLRAMMARLGFVAHQKAERSSDDRQLSDLSEVIDVLAEEFARYDPQRKRALAEIVFHALSLASRRWCAKSLRGLGVQAERHRRVNACSALGFCHSRHNNEH